MSKRMDPNSGHKGGGDTPRRARQMTVYDRLEDARRRRKELLAKGNGPVPRSIPGHNTSAESAAPRVRADPPASEPIPVAPAAGPTAPVAPIPIEEASDHPGPKRSRGGYWMGLLQAMAAIALIAILIAVFRPLGNTPETPETAATTRQPEPVVSAPMEEAPPVEIEPVVATFTVQTMGFDALLAPEISHLGLTIAPLVSPMFDTQPASLAAPAPKDTPFTLNTDDAPARPQSTPPVVLTSTPPSRPFAEIAPAVAPQAANAQLAETTNVVLLVPAFVPQTEAENAVATAASLGIPVDQTRRATVSISQTNIRYFHQEDAEAATILAAGLGGVARDFTNFTPPPNPGVIEVWLEGRGGSNSNQRSATAQGIEADLEALRSSIARALSIAAGN